MLRHKSGVLIKSHIAFTGQTIKDNQQRDVFLVDTRPHELYDGDVMPWAGLSRGILG
ncbi:MAG: hypothetical protein WB729_20160 [Candidatus Sulfotelmatobacter sp.]